MKKEYIGKKYIKEKYIKVRRPPEEGSSRDPGDFPSPEAVASFILNQLAYGDAQRKADLAMAAEFGKQIPFLKEIASCVDLNKREHGAVLEEISALKFSVGGLQSRSALSEERRRIFLVVAKLPEFAPHVANALLTQLGETTVAAQILDAIFPGAMSGETAALTGIAAELGIEIPQGLSQSRPVIPGWRGR